MPFLVATVPQRRTAAGPREVEARDTLDHVGRHNADVLAALRQHQAAVIARKGVNIAKLSRLSGISRERLRKVIEAWGKELRNEN